MKYIWISAHDYFSAQIAVEGGVDVILVGDALGMTIYGFPDTKSVTMEMMLRHAEAVLRGTPKGFPIVVDLPYKTYETPEEALENAQKLRNIGIQHIKLEGGEEIFPQIDALLREGFEVTGHLGLLPQTAESYRVVGKEKFFADKILSDAKEMQRKGVKNIVLECVPHSLAKSLADTSSIPIIGIGAGKYTHGQVLVFSDLIGRTSQKFSPKFLRQFGNSWEMEILAVQKFVHAGKSGDFPNASEWY
jgi:3-methyl-2-oxobutanoate hydroxymethyltransferase